MVITRQMQETHISAHD